MNLAEFGVRKPVVANLIMWVIIGAGLIFGMGLRREFFPETESNVVFVMAPYPGASPDEVERSLATKIEDRLIDLDDVKEMETTVTEGSASINIEFETSVDVDDAVDEVKREIDALQDLPEESERITVEAFEPKMPIIDLTLYGYGDERIRKDAIRAMRDDLLKFPGMGDIQVSGLRNDEILVQVDPAALVEHRLSLVDISNSVRAAMTEVPGGTIRSPSANISLRTVGVDERVEDVRNIPVKTLPGGYQVLLSDVAQVRYGFRDIDVRLRFNNEPAASLTCFGTGKSDIIAIANMVKAYAAGRTRAPLEYTAGERLALLGAEKNPEAPLPGRVLAYRAGLERPPIPPDNLATDNDLSRFISQRLNLLSRNAFWGAVLVFGTLLLMLAPRVALWVTIGLIISVLGTLAVMAWLDITLNLLTMFGLIVVMGLLVDDAIVVAENITSHWEAGASPIQAAINGTRQVSWPVVATVLTTIAAFWPLRLIEGQLGDQMGLLPIVVVCALGVSLLESLLILPAHMGHSLEKAERRKGRRTILTRISEKIQATRNHILGNVLVPRYARLLTLCLRHRYLTLSIALSVLIASAGMVVGKRLPFTFLVSADSEILLADLKMPVGTPIERTDTVMRRLERITMAQPEVITAFSGIGARQSIEGGDFLAQPHLAQMFVELKPVEQRMDENGRRSAAIRAAILEEMGELPDVQSLRIEEIGGGPTGAAITWAVVGDSLERIDVVVDRIKAELARTAGVFGVADDADAGQRELRFTLTDSARELGFTDQSVATQARAAVYGLEAYTFAGDREDIDVRVMFGGEVRDNIAALERTNIFTPDGRPVPLSEVVEVEESVGYATIRRLDRERVVTVSADVNTTTTNTEDITAALRPFLQQLMAENPGIKIMPRGRQQEMKEAFSTLPLGMMMAIGLIYVVLAWLFSSFVQPGVILCAVPFALVGVIWGHVILGYEATFLSLIGLVALIGIVVNDSLIFMQFFNEQRRHGRPIFDALVASGRARLRAIMLTTVTTVLGLSPLMLETSFQARFLIPMAITISFGLIAATAVTLIVLPCLLHIGHDIGRIRQILWTGTLPSEQETDVLREAPPPARLSSDEPE